MSRKSRRNRPAEAQGCAPHGTAPRGAAPQPEPDEAGIDRKSLFIVAAAILLGAFIAAAMVYRSVQTGGKERAAAGNPALASAHSPTFGPAEAKVHIVEFLDPACETCAVFYPHVKKLMAANPGRIRLSLRHVPLHEGSEAAVRILEAARAQDRYPQALEAFLASQSSWVVNHRVQANRVSMALGGTGIDMERLAVDMAAPEVARRMEQDIADAKALGVTKTPEFFVNGRPLPRFGLEELQELVRDEVRRAYPAVD